MGGLDPQSHVLQLRPQREVLHRPMFPPRGGARVPAFVCSLFFGRGSRSWEVKASRPELALALPFPERFPCLSFQRDRSLASLSLLDALT